ncbi:MAG TPA: Asd/ArgC dimerization domain-containing protein [Terriglobales bacterium]|nr:Asd/ArgC dimerization domain-containing protein [Terriglobales bacterium]
MSLLYESRRLVIAGASSLLGTELKSLLEESRLATWDSRLVDEEIAAGILTEAAGEAVVIQPVEGSAFSKAALIFFTGSEKFTASNLDFATHSGATVIDLSGATAGRSTTPWFGGSDALARGAGSGPGRLFFIPSAAAEAIAKLALALTPLGLKNLTVVAFQPVSGADKPGIEELETQTGQLLSFQSLGKQLFDAQIAFNLLDRFGPESMHRLSDFTSRVRKEVGASLPEGAVTPAIQVLHAPVFYGTAFTACAEFAREIGREALLAACKGAGCSVTSEDAAPSNISVAGESLLHLAPPQTDPTRPGTWWFWGAADNIRLPAWNAVQLAEKLVE